MPTGQQLLERVTSQAPKETSFVPLRAVFHPWRCSRPPARQKLTTSPVPITPDFVRWVESRDVDHFDIHRRDQWVDYHELLRAFELSRETSNIAPLSWEVVAAVPKLIVNDGTKPLRGVLTSELVYPKRAWVAPLARAWDSEMAFAVTGILNSAVGYLLYRQRAEELGVVGKDLSENVLGSIPIPMPGEKPEVFSRVAVLSYRLHTLYQMERACSINLDATLKSHWLLLFSDVVALYGWSEEHAQTLLDGLRGLGLEDAPGYQGQFLFERGGLRSPLLPVVLVDHSALERYEQLKARARSAAAGPVEREELRNLRALLYWERHLNFPVPKRLARQPWPGISSERDALKAAHLFLSTTKGEAFGAERPVRCSDALWAVDVFYSPPRNLAPEDRRRLPAGWADAGRHAAGRLWIDAVTGEVRESLEEAQRAAAS